MTTTAATTGPHTLGEWHAAEQPGDGSRRELLAGSWLMTPAPGALHQYAGDELRGVLAGALRGAGSTELLVVTAVGTDLSSSRRDGLIPDVVVCARPLTAVLTADQLRLVVEVWSPGSTSAERSGERNAYAAAGVPFLWEVELDDDGPSRLTVHRPVHGRCTAETTLDHGDGPATLTSAPVPVTVDLAQLRP